MRNKLGYVTVIASVTMSLLAAMAVWVGATEGEAPAAEVPPSGAVISPEVKGELPTQYSQHYLGLDPDAPDVQITLTLTYDPQDQPELDRGIGFWVLDANGLRRVEAGARFHEANVSIAAGMREANIPNNQLRATFKAAGMGRYTVVVYNNSSVPATYVLKAEHATLMDESGQVSAVTPPVTTVEATPTPAVTAVRAVTRTAQPGETYIVQAGDTLSLIAANIYGRSSLWPKLCAFNNLQNCNLLAIGQQLRLPTLEQLDTIEAPSGAQTPAVPTATPTPTS
ncbi:MAG: LysM peptidoglycan-binding domain-containing protein [Anaerolineae bacterium]|nr:LysM peptidoglycan-binding domain-containing protein [Anaerolineae bacterium]MDW8099426.1 LysM peptidoglycan-binding domain-containing protein [Anaerolineae bacterium]